jgi:hypothetical protein
MSGSCKTPESFGREHVYRVWFQFREKDVVNTVYFNIPVKDLD